jgi:hypothetical protein
MVYQSDIQPYNVHFCIVCGTATRILAVQGQQPAMRELKGQKGLNLA